MKQISKRYLSILMTLIMVFGLFSGISLQINAEESKPTQSDISTVEATAQADDITTVLAFTSDTHNGGRQGLDNISAERLATWVENAEAKHGEIDVMGFGGDMGSANSSSPTVFWQNSQNVMNSVTQGVGKGVYTTGNHEYQMGGNYTTAIEDPNSTYYDTVSNYIENSIGDNGSDYVMYCMGSSSYAEPNGGWNRYTDSQISALRTFLNEDHGDKVIFVITHYPLHKTSARTVNGADNVLNLLNTAATEKGLKIVYLWGHNHTDAPNAETNYDKIFKPDDKITDDVGERTIHFYYAAAGCMSDDEYGTGSHSVLGKGLLVTINTKKQLSFTYYDAVGNNVTKGGSYIERDPVPITGVQIVGDDNRPFTDTPSVQEKKSLKLKYKVEPADGTVKTVKWESDDPGIASVDKTTGKVKGVSKGSTKITLTISDGISSEPKTDSIDINVTERESTDLVTYELTNTLEDDGEYLIVNANDGSGYALKNPGEVSGSVNIANEEYKTEVEITDDCIETDETDIVWTASELSSGSGFELTNEDVYLEGSDSKVVFANPQINPGRYWTYSSSNGLRHQNPNSSGYYNMPYTLGYNESNRCFEGNNSYYGSNNKNVYLFKSTTPSKYSVALPFGLVGESKVKAGENYIFTKFDDADEYVYSDVTYSVDWGDPIAITPDANGVYTIEKVSGNLRIIVSLKPKHKYGEPSYSWTEDNSKCTASITCSGCPENRAGHTTTETVNTTYSVVKEATSSAAGVGKYTATFKNDLFTIQTKEVEIPKTNPDKQPDDPDKQPDDPNKGTDPNQKTGPNTTTDPSKDPTKMGIDGTAVGKGASAAAADKAITNMADDKDLPGMEFSKLTLKSPKQTKNSIKLSWKKPAGTKTFVIYGNNCGKANKPKKLATLTGTTSDIKTIVGKKIKKGTYCKFIVVALDNKNMVVSTSKVIHVATKGGKVGNDKSISVKKSVIKKAKKLKVGKSLKVNAKAVPQSKDLKVKKHVAVRYESTNSAIATVSKKGVIKGKKKGTCNVYAYAQNGVFKKIKVVVK